MLHRAGPSPQNPATKVRRNGRSLNLYTRTAMSAESANRQRTPTVVIVGAGVVGLSAAQRIARLPVQVVVVDKKNHHTFQPLLYQVATAGLSPGEIAAPIRWILKTHSNVEVLLEEVVDFNLTQKKVITNNKDRDKVLDYDF